MPPSDRPAIPDLELYQAEWCPFSHRVRMRLTELGLDVVLRQVPAHRVHRTALRARTGQPAIPALVVGDEVVTGADAIIAYLDARHPESAEAALHREHARADWPLWLQLHADWQD